MPGLPEQDHNDGDNKVGYTFSPFMQSKSINDKEVF